MRLLLEKMRSRFIQIQIKLDFFLVQRPKTSIYVGIENQSIRSETDIDLVQINRLFQLQNQKGP